MTDVMTAGVDTGPVSDPNRPPAQADALDEQLVGRLVEQARASGLQLTGEGGLLQRLTKLVVESAMEGEITDHLGYDKHDAAGKNGGNSRNGTRTKTVLTEVGQVAIDVPRDRDGSFEPQIVRKTPAQVVRGRGHGAVAVRERIGDPRQRTASGRCRRGRSAMSGQESISSSKVSSSEGKHE